MLVARELAESFVDPTFVLQVNPMFENRNNPQPPGLQVICSPENEATSFGTHFNAIWSGVLIVTHSAFIFSSCALRLRRFRLRGFGLPLNGPA